MSFAPDIIVTDEDSPRLRIVVETKLGDGHQQQNEAALKSYMLGMSAPLGLIVTPTHLSIYRDSFTDFSNESVKLVSEFDLPPGLFPSTTASESLGRPTRFPEAGFLFERDVQQWLEAMASGSDIHGFTPEAREALAEHVLPALTGGVIRAAGPRELRAS
jgi:hypothetical protein